MWARAASLLPSTRDYAGLRSSWKSDVLAGITVGVVALPLALAFGITAGLGADAGLITAIVAGLAVAVFGGSNVQVSGPTGAMTVVLVPIVSRHGVDAVFAVGLLAGVVMLLAGIAGFGRYLVFIPWPVIEGFTLGIAAIIFLQQVPAALGVAKPEGENTAVVAARAVGDALGGGGLWWALALTALVTVAFDLILAVEVGMAAAAILALRQLAQTSTPIADPFPLLDVETADALRRDHIVSYRFDGALFFGAVQRFLNELASVGDVEVVILRFANLQILDASGAQALGDMIDELEDRHITVLIKGLRPEHHRILEAVGTLERLAHENHIFDELEPAIEHAHSHLVRNGARGH